MQIIITGGAGFLGQRLAKALLNSSLTFDTILLVDIAMPANPTADFRVQCKQLDLSEEGTAKSLITSQTRIIFHLAAVVSSHAEKEFDIGWKVNLDITRQLLEAVRHTNPTIRLVFSSSLAVYGGELPAVVNDTTAVTPRSSLWHSKSHGRAAYK